MAAEYVLSRGRNRNVILCERGIRTFETSTRNTLDLNAIPVLKQRTHLPVLVDPSHGTGAREFVVPLALAAVAAGADGVIVETHPDPDRALSDGPQSLHFEQVQRLLKDLQAIAPVVGRRLDLTTHRVELPRRRRGRRVGYQGVAGAFSEAALRQFFGVGPRAVPCASFEEVFAGVAGGALEAGIVPVENTLGGSVSANLDLLLQYDVKIVGEHILRVQHGLIARAGTAIEDVRVVHAHPQAAAQCARFLRSRRWAVRHSYDTAGSVAALSGTDAAVASRDAADRYGAIVLAESIEDDPRNYTRFVVIARTKGPPGDKCSVIFSTKNEAGALARVLGIFARRKINLTKLESRPIPGSPWEYRFGVDFEGSDREKRVQAALAELRRRTASLKLLGCYPAARLSH